MVNSDNKNRVVKTNRNGRTVQLPLSGNANYRYGGDLKTLAQRNEPFVRDGVTMVSLRLVSEQMGAKVTYTAHPTTPQISIVDNAS